MKKKRNEIDIPIGDTGFKISPSFNYVTDKNGTSVTSGGIVISHGNESFLDKVIHNSKTIIGLFGEIIERR